MITTTQIAWAAGFLEGEGSFDCANGTPRVSAAQVQREPLDRLSAMFGGRIWSKPPSGFSAQPIWTWVLPSRRSVQAMMTLFVLMSPRRQEQIERALRRWRAARNMKAAGSNICRRGHIIEGANAQHLPSRTFPRCRACANAAKRERRRLARLIA